MMPSALTMIVTSIPSPSISFIELGPLRIHFYALCIIVGIIVATIMTNHRLTARGAERWVVIDICLLAVPFAIVFARIYHVVTHWGFYFGTGANPWDITRPGSVWAIWEGGIAIFGALIGGAIGAWLGCRWSGVRFWSFADALAPGMLLAQALGRFGNYFNQELFGLPTTAPWGLEIDPGNAAIPVGLPAGTLFHPTFLYEIIWNVLGVLVLLWLSRKMHHGWGRLFAVYLIWYGAGRVVWESIRIDPSEIILGIRTNVWGAIASIVVGIVVLIVQRRHFGQVPSPYRPGRENGARKAVDSEDTQDDFVDISDPEAAPDDPEAAATSTDVARTGA